MRQLVLIVLCIFFLSVVAVHGQKGKNEPRVLSSPACFFKAGAFLELGEVDRTLYSTGLLDGFFASALFGASDDAVATLNSCTRDMDSKQVSAILTKYVKDHPETWHLPMSIEAYNALNAACPGGLRGTRKN